MKNSIDCGSYTVYFGNFVPAFERIIAASNYTSIAVLVDSNTSKYCLPVFKNSVNFKFSIITIPQGEQNKTLESCEHIWKRMSEFGMDRKSLLVNLGGGVVGDIGGFCASVYMRGIDFMQIPTSLLAQVDASVGGKVGIDFNNLKNYLGVFNFPKAVFVDLQFLKTLPARHLNNGFAESIKHALILDRGLWKNILEIKKCSIENVAPLVYLSVELKQSVVSKDPKESDLRKILNYGHSIGHAIETHSMNKDLDLLHGEAIVIGMICSAFIAQKRNKIAKEELNQIVDVCLFHFDKQNFADDDIDGIIELVLLDKKNEGQKILFTLLEGIGNCSYNQEVNTNDIKESLIYYSSLGIES
jgi:3-dehydroquinate synthase